MTCWDGCASAGSRCSAPWLARPRPAAPPPVSAGPQLWRAAIGDAAARRSHRWRTSQGSRHASAGFAADFEPSAGPPSKRCWCARPRATAAPRS
eukprot:CAMPEP_0115530692 /NCGR_PEP_ID=MMETSP0271-20121206/84634_1 /TAXON_ID=71861 /ORGANISM="Scrippsiella trochoidea, Strain CCMP3099" /LENGTH=93 /DNA_ID=CAMNT_0002962845 /DNA_START=30 /DNA_END=307 /DNA_ORIENTATION=-